MSAYTHHGECSTSDPCLRCFEFGQTTERARIIKLLDQKHTAHEGDQVHNESGECVACDSIAAIAGEK